MTEAATIIGFIAIAFLVVICVFLLCLFFAHVVQCARFILRIRMAVRAAEDKLSDWQLLLQWLRYSVCIDNAPSYLVLKSTDEAIYWPGQEGSRRFPA